MIRSIAVLCQALSTYYGEKVFLLLDEYDTPFMSANSEGYYDEVRAMLNRFLATSLKGNDYLQKAILTGIQRIAKENIFSGLNNLVVCTVQDEDYDDCFGFTEQEVKELLAYCKAEFSDELKKETLTILPSSIHECLIINAEDAPKDIDELREMVKEVNETVVSDQDILSNNVYIYNRTTDKITIA